MVGGAGLTGARRRVRLGQRTVGPHRPSGQWGRSGQEWRRGGSHKGTNPLRTTGAQPPTGTTAGGCVCDRRTARSRRRVGKAKSPAPHIRPVHRRRRDCAQPNVGHGTPHHFFLQETIPNERRVKDGPTNVPNRLQRGGLSGAPARQKQAHRPDKACVRRLPCLQVADNAGRVAEVVPHRAAHQASEGRRVEGGHDIREPVRCELLCRHKDRGRKTATAQQERTERTHPVTGNTNGTTRSTMSQTTGGGGGRSGGLQMGAPIHTACTRARARTDGKGG